MHRMLRAAFTLALAVATLVTLATGGAHAAAPNTPASVLAAGDSLVAVPGIVVTSGSSLASPSGVFTFSVTGTSIEIDEDEQIPGRDAPRFGTSLWWHFAVKGHRINDRSRVTMQRDGNLVLRAHSGRLIWQSHTHGSNLHLQMRNDGNLTIRTPAGRVKWSSHTTAVILPVGRTLMSGRTLVNRYRQQFHITPTYLHMTKRGDLVLRWGNRRTWHSDTRVAGSHLLISTNNRAEIISPAGKVVWRSPAENSRPVLLLDQCGVMTLEPTSSPARAWNPTHKQPTCG